MDDIFSLTVGEEIEIAVRLVLATLFGAAVGYERRSADKPAGIRTLSLVALGLPSSPLFRPSGLIPPTSPGLRRKSSPA